MLSQLPQIKQKESESDGTSMLTEDQDVYDCSPITFNLRTKAPPQIEDLSS